MRTAIAYIIGLLGLVLWGSTAAGQARGPFVADRFDDLTLWTVLPSDGVKGEIVPDVGPDGSPCMRLDFEFVRGGGFVIVQRAVPMALPENYEFAFSVRGGPGTPENNLEFKLLDEEETSVWWVNRRAYRFPNEWRRLVNKRRHLEFAWGPSAGAPLKQLRKLELVVASHAGGKGSVYFDDLTFRELPAPTEYAGTPVASANISLDGTAAASVLDPNAKIAWRSGPTAAEMLPAITLDFGSNREFGGLSIEWDQEAPTKVFDVEVSDDGRAWQAVRGGVGGVWTAFDVNQVAMTDAEARFVRLTMTPAEAGRGVGVRNIKVRELPFGSSPNEMYHALAAEAPRGRFPRMWSREQSYWTIVGVNGDDREGLLSEDGALELERRSASVEPFVYSEGKLLTWAEGQTSQSLEQGYLPIPTVTRVADGLELKVTAFASGEPGGSTLLARYQLKNARGERAVGALFLALRPFQVNPPWQFLTNPGGVGVLDRIVRGSDGVKIEAGGGGQFTLRLLPEPEAFGAGRFDEGEVSTLMALGQVFATESADDPLGLASAAARYAFDLGPGETMTVVMASPSGPSGGSSLVPKDLAQAEELLAQTRAYWTERLNRVTFRLPGSAARMWDIARTTLAYILINRDGPAIQPGSRSYERSWARDGSMTSAALLEFGLSDEVRQWIEWFAPNQFESGKVPCVVDKRGPDPVAEHDSHGQLIFAIANYHRYRPDREFLRAQWERVRKAVAYMDSLRAERKTAEFAKGTTVTRQEPGKPAVNAHAFYGLFPESISHEGYSAKPMHSYWDDLFGLLGYKEAVYIARELGETAQAAAWEKSLLEFRKDFAASIAMTQAAHGIDYLPGCVELGDFDATSTTVALWPTGEAVHLPQKAVRNTFDRYWAWFQRRRDDPAMVWNEYTPYEHRVTGAMVRLGEKARAHEVMAFFLKDVRPAAWNQWGEIVWKVKRTPKFIGDMPHTWVGSDYLNSFRSLFAYEQEVAGGSGMELVLLAGVPRAWVLEAGESGLGFDGAATVAGRLSCNVTHADGKTTVKLSGDAATGRAVPMRVCNPMREGREGPAGSATVDGRPVKLDDQGRVLIERLPATVEFVGP